MAADDSYIVALDRQTGQKLAARLCDRQDVVRDARAVGRACGQAADRHAATMAQGVTAYDPADGRRRVERAHQGLPRPMRQLADLARQGMVLVSCGSGNNGCT